MEIKTTKEIGLFYNKIIQSDMNRLRQDKWVRLDELLKRWNKIFPCLFTSKNIDRKCICVNCHNKTLFF